MSIKIGLFKKNIFRLFFLAFLVCIVLSFAENSYASGVSAKKEEINVLKSQIKLELNQLKAIESKISHVKASQKAKVKNLIPLYSSMSPKSAATILPSINKGIAIYILSHMPPKTASAILSRMPIKDAVFFTNSMAGK